MLFFYTSNNVSKLYMVQYIMAFALDFVLITKVQKKRADRKG